MVIYFSQVLWEAVAFLYIRSGGTDAVRSCFRISCWPKLVMYVCNNKSVVSWWREGHNYISFLNQLLKQDKVLERGCWVQEFVIYVCFGIGRGKV
jgi:hypothetical protein